MNEPPVQITYPRRFHSGSAASLWDEPSRSTYQQAAKRLAFRALTSGNPAAELLHVFRLARPGEAAANDHHIMGIWVVGGPDGTVTAHRGGYVGPGSCWELANAIVPGSAHAVRAPVLTGYYRDRPEQYRELVANHEAAMRRLLARHSEAVGAGNLYATLHMHRGEHFTALVRAAVDDRAAQLILHDWLVERGFPHADELRSKRRNRGKLTERQLLDLLTKPLAAVRRSFSGRTI